MTSANGLGLFAPLVMAAMLAWATAVVAERRHPMGAARSTLTVMVLAAVATLPLVGHLIAVAVLEIPRLGRSIHEGFHPGAHRSGTPAWMGFAGVAWATALFMRVGWLVSRYRGECASSMGGTRVVRDARPVAHVLPGATPTVVLSDGLIDRLEGPELEAVLAHERAHALLRHGRLLLVARLCVAVAPFLRPVMTRYEFFLERVADEHAARCCGDRLIVARALARTAVARGGLAFSPAIAGVGVLDRVNALRFPQPRAPRSLVALAGGAVAGVTAFATLQVHHVMAAVRSICGF